MIKKNILLIILGVIIVFFASAGISYYFWFSRIYFNDDSSVSFKNNNANNQNTNQDNQTASEWRESADLSEVKFTAWQDGEVYNYQGQKISLNSCWIKNPTTGDKQSVRFYSSQKEQDQPLVVLVPGGSGDGSEAEKAPPNGYSNAVELAAAGFRVLVYSPLGTGNSEGEINYQGFDDQDGLAAIIAAGKKLDNVDANNIGLASFSYGVTGATGVLARYPELNVKFYSDWEGPSSRSFTNVDCRPPESAKKDHAPGAFACDDDTHWLEREAVKFIAAAQVQYYWRIQQEKDHVQKTYGHTLEMMQAAAGKISWIKLNNGEVNADYQNEEDLPIVPNEKDYFSVYVIPHLVEMSER